MSNCGVCFILRHYLDSFGRDVTCESCGTLWRVPIQNDYINNFEESINDYNDDAPIISRPHSRASSGDSSTSSNYPQSSSSSYRPTRRKITSAVDNDGRPVKHLVCENDWCTYYVPVKRSQKAAEGLLKSHEISCKKNREEKRRYKSVMKSSGMKSGVYVPYETDAFKEAQLDNSALLSMIKNEPVDE
ncbi:unnamed protein product [Oikopleura dioica]|uniref:Uncharacterized protein n=1 Tax=Oikopleura dioica TaxID=34765 RepID=E4YG26_OIKDI|nr:unnamed protein product [Oikopleura dioica]